MPEPATDCSGAEKSSGRGSAARRDAEALHLRPGVDPSRPPSAKGRLWLVLLLALTAGGGYWWHEANKDASKDASYAVPAAETGGAAQPAGTDPASGAPATAQSAAPETSLDGALGLALQGISLFSGEKGAELWRLKATYAHLSREGNQIDVDKPVVRYIMGNPGDPGFQDDFLDVKSDRGRITDNQRFVNLWGNVDVRRFEETLTGSRLDYDSQTRVMVFPEGATMDGPKASGEAARFTWDLSNNVLTAENGVTVVFKPQEEAAAPQDATAESATSEPAKETQTVTKAQTPAAPRTVVPPKTSAQSTAQKNKQKAPAVSSQKKRESQKSTTSSRQRNSKTSDKKTSTKSQNKSGTSATKQPSSAAKQSQR